MAAGLLLPSRRMWSPDPTPPPDHLLLPSQQLLEIFCSFRGAVPHSTFSLPRSQDAHRPILAHSASLAVHKSRRLQQGKKELRFTLKLLCRHYCYKIAFGTFRRFCIFVNPQAWELALSMTPGCSPLLRGEKTDAVSLLEVLSSNSYQLTSSYLLTRHQRAVPLTKIIVYTPSTLQQALTGVLSSAGLIVLADV